MVRGVGQLYRVAESARFSNDCSHFKLEVKSFNFGPLGSLRIQGDLTLWSDNILWANNDCGGSSMIADWEMKPVRLESIVWSSDHDSYVVSMVLARVEVCVISYIDWHSHLSFILGDDRGLFHLQHHRISFEIRSLGEKSLDSDPSLMPEFFAQLHECIQVILSKYIFSFYCPEKRPFEKSSLFELSQINYEISNSGAAMLLSTGLVDSKGNILEREWV
jgi:hypothetical protein